MATTPHTNQLIHETSPYLLQHAHNPVNWYPWGEEALQKAREENKVILVSIGYSACHWCHVMERESFEDETVAGFMNSHFVNIKIDREERPDLDHIYMDAVQAMTGSGGWPLNVFLTPGAKPFYGGTYFPPIRAHGRASWTETLYAIRQAWQQRSHEIMDQADQLTSHLQQSVFVKTGAGNKNASDPEKADCDSIFVNIMRSADKEWGGFGKAPKFPQFFTIQWLLQYYYFSGNEEARSPALLSINKMLQGGIYDHAGGGLARYSTDNEWLVPHFEKMLYDNAQFITVLSEAYQLTGDAVYEKAVRDTIDFLQRECWHPGEGYCAALDADSEGEEGKFYVWTYEELQTILGGDAAAFCSCYGVTAKGNFEGKNILHLPQSRAAWAVANGKDPVAVELQMDSCLAKLLTGRANRSRPQIDDKKLLGWNALMVTALAKAAAALGDTSLKEQAKNTFNIILKNFRAAQNPGGFCHSFKAGQARFPAFLDDLAALIQAAIRLFELCSDSNYLRQAVALTNHVMDKFWDEEKGYFFFTSRDQDDCIIRKKEIYDGATASGNSLMMHSLSYLALVTDNPYWKRISDEMAAGVQEMVIRYPTSFSVWAAGLLSRAYGLEEIVITGKNMGAVRDALLRRYMPGLVLHGATEEENYPLLSGKIFGDETLIYRCVNYSCQAPVKTLEDLHISDR